MEIVDIDWNELVKDGPTVVYRDDLSPPLCLSTAKRGTARNSLIKSHDVQGKKKTPNRMTPKN